MHMSTAYLTQHKYHNHLPHSKYCSTPPFHRSGKPTHKISSVGVSCFCSLIVLDIFDELCHEKMKGRMLKKKKISQEI